MTWKPNCYAIAKNSNGEGYRFIGSGWSHREARREGFTWIRAEFSLSQKPMPRYGSQEWAKIIEDCFKVILANELSQYNLTEEDYDPYMMRKALNELSEKENEDMKLHPERYN